jgi:hypothetical protein
MGVSAGQYRSISATAKRTVVTGRLGQLRKLWYPLDEISASGLTDPISYDRSYLFRN